MYNCVNVKVECFWQAEGIFRINAENSHHEHVRDQLNKGIVPMDIDLHCLASLIKVIKFCRAIRCLVLCMF